ncbi:MAG: fasciclin domain-containing protein [Phycisphaerales bacterium]
MFTVATTLKAAAAATALAATAGITGLATAGTQCSASKMMTVGEKAQACGSSCGAMTETVMVGAVADDIVDTAIAAGSFNTLVAAVQAAGLVDALKGDGPFTVFAPTDEAFAKLPAGTVESLLRPENRDQLTAILTYHVVSGKVDARTAMRVSGATTLNGQRIDIASSNGGVTIDGANVIKADIETSNGVIHVIDSVILPTNDNLVSLAASAGSFNTLLAAAQAAGLAEALMGEGPFTIFAPTDDAFAKLPAGTVESLLLPENKDKLASVLKYHVVPGRVSAAAAVKAGSAETLLGETLVFGINDGRLTVDGVSIIDTDIDASNGVVHVVDRVILP